MKRVTLYALAFCLFFCCGKGFLYSQSQFRKPQNLPYADQKMYHFGFLLGVHGQDLIFSHTGHTSPNGEVWFAEIPSYSVGLSVGMIADRYLSQYFNLRATPTLHFGEKKFIFKEQNSGEEYIISPRSTYLTLPIQVKFNAARSHNARPYVTGGFYVSTDLSTNKNAALRFNSLDYGLEFGLGCNIYLPLFKLCPELKFSLGLADIINKDMSDISDEDIRKFRSAINTGKNRMISLIFNFE